MQCLLFSPFHPWNFWPARRFFKCYNKWKLLGRRSGLCTEWSKTSQLKHCNNCCFSLTVCALALFCSKQTLHVSSPHLLFWIGCPSLSVFHNMLQCLWWSLRCKITQETPFNPSRQLPWFYGCWCFEFLCHGRMTMAPHHHCNLPSGVWWTTHFHPLSPWSHRTQQLPLIKAWEK
jgi:hypothetical protein